MEVLSLHRSPVLVPMELLHRAVRRTHPSAEREVSLRSFSATQFPAKQREPTYHPGISSRASCRRTILSPLERALRHSQKQCTPAHSLQHQSIITKPQGFGSPPLIPIRNLVLPIVEMQPNISRHSHSIPNVRLVSRPTPMPHLGWYLSASHPIVSSVEASSLSSADRVIVATAGSAFALRAPPLGRRR